MFFMPVKSGFLAASLLATLVFASCGTAELGNQGKNSQRRQATTEERYAAMPEKDLLGILYRSGGKSIGLRDKEEKEAVNVLVSRGSEKALQYFIKTRDVDSVVSFVYANHKKKIPAYEAYTESIIPMVRESVDNGMSHRSAHSCFRTASHAYVYRILAEEDAENLAAYLEANLPDAWRGTNCRQLVVNGLRGVW
jgi:hypothetical protein